MFSSRKVEKCHGCNNALIYVALDQSQRDNIALAKKISDQLPDEPYGFKINIDSVLVFTGDAMTPRAYLDQIASLGKPIFLDIKMHNGPNPMMRLAESVKDLVDVIDIHASAGRDQIKCVSNVLKGARAKLFALTLLTHDKIEDTEKSLEEIVKLANEAISGGAYGLIMPSTMLVKVRRLFPDIPIISPGIRPEWFQDKKANYQQEISTPADAINNGATALVIGTPICKSNDPVQALKMVLSELGANKKYERQVSSL